MKIKRYKSPHHQLAASLFFAISAVSLPGQCASVQYNHTINFDKVLEYAPNHLGLDPSLKGTCAYGGCPKLSIDFTYDTDTRTISNVSSLHDIVSQPYSNYVNISVYPDAYTRSVLSRDGITGTYYDGRRYNPGTLSAAYFINNNDLDPLSLVPITNPDDQNGFWSMSTGNLNPGRYYATSQNLTNLSSVSNVPLPPALLMFASSCLGLGFVGFKRKNIMCR